MDAWLVGFMALAGALIYSLWKYYGKWVETHEQFDFHKTALSVIPVIVLAFVAGYNHDFQGVPLTVIGIISFGYTFASIQNDAGVTKENAKLAYSKIVTKA